MTEMTEPMVRSAAARGRVAVISGATSGIGQAAARELLAGGYRVVGCGRREDRLESLGREHNQREKTFCGVAGDATRRGFVRTAFGAATSSFAVAPHAFLLCAGRGLAGSVLTSDEHQWAELVALNYVAALQQLRECAQLFLAAPPRPDDCRDIVVIGSTIGRQVSKANPVYGSTKFALHSLVESLRQELCSANIRVTLIEPGFVRTEFQGKAGYDLAWFDQLERESGPFLKPDDVARSIAFVLAQPPHVHVDDIRIRPTRQAV